MRDLNFTKRFRRYRDAVRLVWNVFLEGYPDQEDQYDEVEPGLFRGVLESGLDRNLLPTNDNGHYRHYPDLIVKSPERYAYFLNESNQFLHYPLPRKLTLNYSTLFDFAWETGNSRDFEFVQCVASTDVKLKGGRIVLLQARSAKVLFRPHHFAVSTPTHIRVT
jgi:hypothetical protein